MAEIENRKQLITKLAEKAFHANLGFFVGTGFSIAVNPKTCNFENLVRSIYNSGMHDDGGTPNFDKDRKEKPELFFGKSYPQIVEDIEKEKGRELVLAVVVQRCSINISDERVPKKNEREKENENDGGEQLKRSLSIIAPQWAITTNYDLILEQLFENSKMFGPKDFLSVHIGITPIFHIHGHVRNPDDIVISEKDYSNFLSSNIYRRQKLSSLLAESSVLFMGYSLGDINVRTALKEARLFFPEKRDDENIRVLLLYNQESLDSSEDNVEYNEDEGLYILKMNSIKKILKEIAENVEKMKYNDQQKIANINTMKEEIKYSKEYRKKMILELDRDSPKVLNEKSNIFLNIIIDMWKEYSHSISCKETPNRINLIATNMIDIVVDLIYSKDVLLLKPELIYKMVRILDQLLQDNQKCLDSINKKNIPQCVYKEIINIIESNGYINLKEVFELPINKRATL